MTDRDEVTGRVNAPGVLSALATGVRAYVAVREASDVEERPAWLGGTLENSRRTGA
jgi:hypothetical protein